MKQIIGKVFGMDKDTHIPELDGIRAIAVLMVFLYHSWGVIGTPKLLFMGTDLSFLITWGHAGVNLFYILSGFLLFMPFAKRHYEEKEPPKLWSYFFKRALRILPLYYSYLIITILLTRTDLISTAGLKTVVINFLFLQNFFRDHMINGVTWTLAIEVQFYLLLPIVARFFVGKKSLISFLLSILVVMLYRFAVFYNMHPNTAAIDWEYYFNSEYNLLGCFDNFAIGMLVANLYMYALTKNKMAVVKIKLRSVKKIIWLTPFWFAFCLYTYYTWRFETNSLFSWYYFSFFFDVSTYIIFAVLLVYVLFYQSKLNTLLRNFYLRIFGITAYSIYIWHLPMMSSFTGINFVSKTDGWEKWLHFVVICIVIIIPFSMCMYIFIEKYFMDISRRLSKRSAVEKPLVQSTHSS